MNATPKTKVCLLRYHDGTAKPNWGGRATSLALATLIERSPRYALASVVNGILITRNIAELAHSTPTNIGARALGRLGIRLGGPFARAVRLASLDDAFSRIEPLAATLLSASSMSDELSTIRSAIDQADEVWMNGEGAFTLAPGGHLLRALVYMQMAIGAGKRLRLVNSILATQPGRQPDRVTTDAVGRVLAQCTSISYRDPQSLALHRRLFPGIAATFVPDALFSWAQWASRQADADRNGQQLGPALEGLPPGVQNLLLQSTPFVVVAGSSLARDGRANGGCGEKMLRGLIDSLCASSLVPIVCATCDGDDWMLPVGRNAGCETVPARIPLGAGLLLLSRAACFVSGRYHPSIMASLGGTPCVFMTSSSHKTSSLQEVLGTHAPVEFPFFTQMTDPDAVAAATLAEVARGWQLREAIRARALELSHGAQDVIAPATSG